MKECSILFCALMGRSDELFRGTPLAEQVLVDLRSVCTMLCHLFFRVDDKRKPVARVVASQLGSVQNHLTKHPELCPRLFINVLLSQPSGAPKYVIKHYIIGTHCTSGIANMVEEGRTVSCKCHSLTFALRFARLTFGFNSILFSTVPASGNEKGRQGGGDDGYYRTDGLRPRSGPRMSLDPSKQATHA